MSREKQWFKMRLPTVVLYLLLAVGVNGELNSAGFTVSRPNFVVFMADDLGYGDLGFTGNQDVETPNIDALGRESVFFPNFYVAPVCTPTRAALLTGRNPLRTGIWGVHGGRDFLNLDETTFAKQLGEVGYATGLFGKWHNGKTDGYFPWSRGFEEACMTKLYEFRNNKANCNGREVQTEGWVQDVIASWANDFITRKKNEGKEFMLYIPFMTPHLGNADGVRNTWPAIPSLVEKYIAKGLSQGLSQIYAMIEMMDTSVGAIVNHLDNLGLGEDTVVMFYSDNGATGQRLIEDWERRNHVGLSGNKGRVDENGIRSPLFVRKKGSFPAGATANTQLAIVEDIFPTLVDLAGAGMGEKPIDGLSLASVLYNPGEDFGFSQRTLYHSEVAPYWVRRNREYTIFPNFGKDKSGLRFGREGQWAIREGKYKYVFDYGKEYLYNMLADPKEENPIQDPFTTERLKRKLLNWWQDIVADFSSFSTPRFYIGYPGSSSGVILPSATAEKQGNWILREHWVDGRVGAGDYMSYNVNVAKAGGYQISVDTSGNMRGTLRFSVTCGMSTFTVEGQVGQDGYVGYLEIPEIGTYCTMTMTALSEWEFVRFNQIRFEPASSRAADLPELASRSSVLPGLVSADPVSDRPPGSWFATPPEVTVRIPIEARADPSLEAPSEIVVNIIIDLRADPSAQPSTNSSSETPTSFVTVKPVVTVLRDT